MSDKHFVGLDITGFENNGKTRPISRVTLLVDSENAVTAGDDTGMELVADCPHATQTMVDTILAQVKGYQYQMYSADDANLDPAAELGDGATVNGVYSVIARIDDDGSGYSSISAPGEEELEDEYPSSGPMTQEFDRKIATTRSLITKTAEQIRLEVTNEVEGLSSSFTVELDSISAEIESMDGRVTSLDMGLDGISAKVTDNTNSIAALDLYVDSLTLSVSNGSTSSVISLKAGSTTISSQNITMSGLVTYTGLADGTTTINGGCIQTGLIEAEYLDLTGAITWSDLSRTVQNDINDAYTMAEDAQTVANDVDDIVSSWSYTYGGTTYIDGEMLMTGTVIASSLQGGEVLLLDDSGRTAGSITLEGASSYSGRKVVLESGAIELSSIYGDIYAENSDGTYWQLSGSEMIIGYGDLRSNQAAKWDLGTASWTWNNVYAESCEACTSDREKKHDIEPLPGKYLNMLLDLPVYRFKLDSGTSGRYHPGYTAQDVEEYMSKHGIDSSEFGGFIKDVDENGDTIYMLRYGEFIPLHTAVAQKHEQEIADMKAEIQNLKIKMEAAGL